MNPQIEMERWLRKTVNTGRVASILGAFGLLVLAAGVLFVTFWIAYFVIFLAVNWIVPLSPAVHLGLTAVAMVLLFIGNALTDRRYLESVSFTTGTFADKPVTIYVPGVGLGSTINPLAIDSAQSYVKTIANILCTGPRLLTAVPRLLGRARRFSGLDIEGCAAVLAHLANEDGRVPFAKLAAEIPAGHDVSDVLTQLREIDGVMVLKSEPPGMSLGTELRKELRKVVLKRKRKGQSREGQAQP
jgi:hypothetical protein